MIYISSSCVKHQWIKDAVLELANAGFTHIELSGGTTLYENLAQDLLELKESFNLSYLCHNYFPPPPQDFVLNLASLDPKVSEMSLAHIERSIALSQLLGANKFAFHAGFCLDIPLDQIGKKIARYELYDRQKAYTNFVEHARKLIASSPVALYIENNVLSKANNITYKGQRPFFLLDSSDAGALSKEINYKLLLDVAHLKVSCNSLDLPFGEELEKLAATTDYIHLSDNNAEHDSNSAILKDSDLYNSLKGIELRNKTLTLEVYSGLKDVETSYRNILDLL